MRLCPWADAVYGCDGAWWKANGGLPDFPRLKMAHDSGVCATYPDVHKIEIETAHRIFVDKPGRVGNGGNSGFQAINIAVQFGAMRILLIGFDMHSTSGLHWYGKNKWKGANNPRETNFPNWRNHLLKAAPALAALGVEVVNASPSSALTCFRHKPIEEALREWQL